MPSVCPKFRSVAIGPGQASFIANFELRSVASLRHSVHAFSTSIVPLHHVLHGHLFQRTFWLTQPRFTALRFLFVPFSRNAFSKPALQLTRSHFPQIHQYEVVGRRKVAEGKEQDGEVFRFVQAQRVCALGFTSFRR